ncbi:MAG: hypothetical protein QMD97_05160, partial [Candidatus Aenigmarchaeota archaeon]|nr:hypothetical protein [Candidatus Aenigmarchaeota archaeon]
LYQEAKYSQSDIIKITREMRDKGATDAEIIAFLDLKNKAPFKMDREYLRKLFGFVTSRTSRAGDMYNNWVRYHQRFLSNPDKNIVRKPPSSLTKFIGGSHYEASDT